MFRLFAHRSTVLVVVLVEEVDVVVMVVVEVDVVVVVVSQLLQVLVHWCANSSQRFTANNSVHFFKDNVFLLLIHRCVMVVEEVLVEAVEVVVVVEVVAGVGVVVVL